MLYDDSFLTVSQLNDFIKDVLQMGFPQRVWVCGEIQGYNRNKDKSHVFFELCEKELQSNKVVARIGLVIFSGRKAAINDILDHAENAFQLKDDIEVKFLCKVDFYPPHGAVRLIVESIDPTYTLGKIAQEKQRLVALLKKKGTFERNKALPFPVVPLGIGLITAFDSAAYNDFMAELASSGYGFTVLCRNTLMQGKKAEKDVCQALDTLQNLSEVDLIVITRGGGSIAELSCFDSQLIAEKIAEIKVPVVSGIGHEINMTITDMAAYAFQKTPTAVARYLVERIQDFLTGLNRRGQDLLGKAQDIIKEREQKLTQSVQDLRQGVFYSLTCQKQELTRFEKSLALFPFRILKRSAENIQSQQKALGAGADAFLKNAGARLKHCRTIVELARPENLFRKGFSLTRLPDGSVLKSIEQLQSQDIVRTKLLDGCFESRVNHIYKEESLEGDQVQ